MFISETSIQAVLRDIRNGNSNDVETFFSVRPDWLNQDGKATEQTDNKQAEKEEA